MSPNPESKSAIDLLTIYYLLFRHKGKILLFTFIGLLAAAAVFVLYPKSYQSSATLMVRYVMDSRSFREDMGYEMRSPDARGNSIINNEVAILLSEDLLAEVVEELGPQAILADQDELSANWGPGERIIRKIQWELGLAYEQGKPKSMAIRALQKHLRVENSRTSNIITLNYASPDPTKVAPVLEKVIERYLVRHQAIHGASDAYDFLTQQTELLRNRLTKTEDELRELKAKADVTDLDQGQRLLAEQIRSLEEEIRATEADLAARAARIADAEKAFANTLQEEPEGPAPDPHQLNLYQAALRQLSDAKLMEMEALSQFKENSAPVKQAQLRVQHLRKNLAELRTKATGGGLRNLTTRLDTLQDLVFEEQTQASASDARLKVLKEQLKTVKTKAEKTDQYTAAIVQMERQQELEESNYRYFSKNLEQARIDKALESGKLTNIGLIQAPSLPRPNFISKIKLVLIVFFAIAAVGLFLAIVLELFLDQSIRRPADIEQGMRLPLMLAIPTLRHVGSRRRRNKLLTGGTQRGKADRDFAVANPLQIYIDALRDRVIMSMSGVRRPRFLGVTSCGPSAGVTTIAAGLALSLSRSGNGRILLIDANFLNGTKHPFYQKNPSSGLMDVLSGEIASPMTSPMQIQQSLYMLSPGEVNGELSRISLAERFNLLMDHLRQADFDYIIVDLPPIDLTSTSFRLAGLMDRNLLVVESETTTKEEARRTLNILNQTEAKISGVVLNRTRKYLPKRINKEL